MKNTGIKKIILLFLAAFVTFAGAQAQTLKEFFGADNVNALYLGIDFTKAKLIDITDATEKDIVDRHYPAINEGAATDTKKESLAIAFHKSSMDHDLGPVNKRNGKIDPSQIKSTNTADFHRLKEEDISALVKGFDFAGKKGLGILFVMEAMSKTGKAAAIWVTFIDMGTRKMLYTERMEEKVGMGFGFKNYWVIPVRRLMSDIRDDKFSEWKRKFS